MMLALLMPCAEPLMLMLTRYTMPDVERHADIAADDDDDAQPP